MDPYLLRENVVHDVGDPSHIEVPIQVQPLGWVPGGARVNGPLPVQGDCCTWWGDRSHIEVPVQVESLVRAPGGCQGE